MSAIAIDCEEHDFVKLALVTDAWHPQINGVVRTWSTVTQTLEARGHEVCVVHPGTFKRFPVPKYPEVELSILPGRQVRRMLQEFGPDAIHIATEGPLGLAARSFCRRRDLPFTTSFHTHFAKYGEQYFHVPAGLTFSLLRWFHSKAQRTLVPTPSVGRELEEAGFRNIVVWTRGVDTELFRPRATDVYRDLVRPISIYCGRVAREKNIHAFLEADVPGTKVIIGDGPARAALERSSDPKRVLWAGYHTGEGLAERIAGGDVFVFPSKTDTFGVVMLEAMACGLPVAAHPVIGPIDVVRSGETGVLHDDIAVAIIRALDLSPAACRRQAEEYSWERCAQIVVDNLAMIESAAGAHDPRKTVRPPILPEVE